MQARPENQQNQQQTQRIGPQLIHANWILQCSNTELLQAIEQERLENPALEAEITASGGCGQCPRLDPSQCKYCPFSGSGYRDSLGSHSTDGDSPSEKFNVEDHMDDDPADMRSDGMDLFDNAGDFDSGINDSAQSSDYDPLSLVASHTSLEDQLIAHLRATSTSQQQLQIDEYLVNSLDERGYLTIDIGETCGVLGVSESEVLAEISRLQSCDPPGIGARDLHECLMLQLRALKESGVDDAYDPVAAALVRDHWDALTQRRTKSLARKLDVSVSRLDIAIRFVKSNLIPHPANAHRPSWETRPDSGSVVIRADVVIHKTVAGFTVEILGNDIGALHINPYYKDLYDQIRDTRKSAGSRNSVSRQMTEEHSHIMAYVERANLFLTNLHRRRRTILKIANAIVEFQQGFLHTGQRNFLRPLTRTELAQRVGIHESTISRALLHKYVQLPSMEVVSFDLFFGRSSNARDIISEMVRSENPKEPLSDQAIVDGLQEQGLTLARRTIVKYREELRIPASYLRRQR